MFDPVRPLVGPAESRPWGLALIWLAGLAPFFFVTYGLANWAAGLREHVPSLAFDWEHRIPFLPWTIVPYWSTDLFYAASLFLCSTRAELYTLGKRLIAVQVLCAGAFLLVPLRFSFERPYANGVFGQMFDALMSFDKPFNQAPSLHVALTAVLWAAYSRHVHRWMLWTLRSWFLMMALSTLTTYQHHFIDLPTGLWVGLFSISLLPYGGRRFRFQASRDPRRFVLTAAYFLGAATCAFLAWWFGGLAWLLLWLAAALIIVAAIYLSGHPEFFGKSDGLMPPATIAILAPYSAAAWVNSRWHTHGAAPAQEIAGGVWLGRIPGRAELHSSGMVSVVDLTAELPFRSRGVVYRGIPMLDLLTPTKEQLESAVKAILELDTARPTLVFCALGYSRSAAAVAAWLIASGRAPSASAAIESIRDCRPAIVLPSASRALLEQWAVNRAGG